MLVIVIFHLSIGRDASNAPRLWKLLKKSVSLTLAGEQRCVFRLCFPINWQRWNKELSALFGYPFCTMNFLSDIPIVYQTKLAIIEHGGAWETFKGSQSQGWGESRFSWIPCASPFKEDSSIDITFSQIHSTGQYTKCLAVSSWKTVSMCRER